MQCDGAQRGARECHAWNERIYLTAIIRLRLRRAEWISELWHARQ